MPGAHLESVAHNASCVESGQSNDEEAALARVHALAAGLAAHRVPGIVDMVPARASPGECFDLQQVEADALAT